MKVQNSQLEVVLKKYKIVWKERQMPLNGKLHLYVTAMIIIWAIG